MSAPLVHILLRGEAVCGLRGTPAEWPEGSKWVAYNDPQREVLCTCEVCRARLAWRCRDCGTTSTTAQIIAASSLDVCPKCRAEDRFDATTLVAMDRFVSTSDGARVLTDNSAFRITGTSKGASANPERAKYDLALPWIVALRRLLPMLAAAKIPVWQPGMRAVDVEMMVGEVGMVSRVTVDARHATPRTWLTLDGGMAGGQWFVAMHGGDQAVPDMTHRATYLLVVDILERVGVEAVHLLPDIDDGIQVDLAELRSLCEAGTCWWSTDPRDSDGGFVGIVEAIRAALDGAVDEEA